MAWLNGKYDENGQRVHQCAMPWVLLPNLSKGSVWVCDCGRAWRYDDGEWQRVPSLDDEGAPKGDE